MIFKPTFRGGIRLKRRMTPSQETICKLSPPTEILVPLLQWQGTPAVPTVEIGEAVMRGQMIGASHDPDGCPVFSGISGRVTAIALRPAQNGMLVPFIRIQNDGQNRTVTPMPFQKSLHDASREELLTQIDLLGIIDTAGLPLPLCTKLRSIGNNVDTLIVNCAESDPFLHHQYALLKERADEMINGAKTIMAAAKIGHACLVVGESKHALLPIIRRAIGQSDLFEVLVTREKYPQSHPHLLLNVVSGQELPVAHTPQELGYGIVQAETCVALFEAMVSGLPQTERLLTVGGDAASSCASLSAVIGTPVSELSSFCDMPSDAVTVWEGGIMTGHPVLPQNAEAVITAQTDGILFCARQNASSPQKANAVTAPSDRPAHSTRSPVCLHCGKCVSVCPMQLLPTSLAHAVQHHDFAGCLSHHIEACIACGACSYVCPSGIPITALICSAKDGFPDLCVPESKSFAASHSSKS